MKRTKRITYETVGARAIVRGDAVVACTTVEARIRPALVPINLTVDPRVAVDAVTGVSATRGGSPS